MGRKQRLRGPITEGGKRRRRREATPSRDRNPASQSSSHFQGTAPPRCLFLKKVPITFLSYEHRRSTSWLEIELIHDTEIAFYSLNGTLTATVAVLFPSGHSDSPTPPDLGAGSGCPRHVCRTNGASIHFRTISQAQDESWVVPGPYFASHLPPANLCLDSSLPDGENAALSGSC